MDEVKNILDYKVGHYKYEDIPPTYNKNVLWSFMFIKQKIPNSDMDKLKEKIVADDTYYFNIATYRPLSLHSLHRRYLRSLTQCWIHSSRFPYMFKNK
jgi:hypothetical protein